MLSIIIITKNEAAHIRQCLESVAFADEIIVLDSGSSDATVAICQQFTDQVYQTDWPGFGLQKQRALDKATGDWVLSIDADEWLSPDLQQDIKAAVQQSQYAAYKIPRRAIFCGHTIKRGGFNYNYIVRLFRREQGHFTDAKVHETIKVNGAVGQLRHCLLHESHLDLSEALDKINRYSSLSAENLAAQGKSAHIGQVLLKTLWTFINSYVLQLLFLDGKYGFMYAVCNAHESYYKQAKLLLLTQQQSAASDSPSTGLDH